MKGLLDDWLEEHDGNLKRESERMEVPPEPHASAPFLDREPIAMDYRLKEVNKEGKKLVSVSVIFDVGNREIPLQEIEVLNKDLEHWLTYLGLSVKALYKGKNEGA